MKNKVRRLWMMKIRWSSRWARNELVLHR